MRIRHITALLVLILLLSFGSLMTQAQSILTYGQGVVGTVSAEAPIAFYSFQGNAGDSVTIQVIGLTSGLQPAISLNTPTGQQVASSNVDPTNVLADAARLTYRLDQAGVHTIIVLSPTGVLGDFAIRLDGVATTQESQPDATGNSSSAANVGSSLFVYTIPATPVAQVATISTDTAGVSFSVSVTSPAGQQIGLLSGGSDQAAITTLPAGTGAYTLEVAVSAQNGGSINLNVAPLGNTAPALPTSAPSQPEQPVVTEEVAPVQPTDVPQQQPTTVPQPTAVPQQQPTTVPPTTAPQQVQPTATFTPSYTPTTPATATFTPSYTPTTEVAAQEAPPDARFNNPLNIQLDNTASVLDFVSYPGGDTEDRVSWDIIGMNNNSSLPGGRARLVISVSCFGEGTDNVQFFTGGQTYACGQTIVDREVTAGQKTGSVVITAVGGNATYVQWVLTGTATRVN